MKNPAEYVMIAHEGQLRRYTGMPYWQHPAEVAGLFHSYYGESRDGFSASWLHDVLEDTLITYDDLVRDFNENVAKMVLTLSDLEAGNRATRKNLARKRLASSDEIVQAIKFCDIWSNGISISVQDRKFWPVFRDECLALTEVMKLPKEELRSKVIQMLKQT